MKPLSIAFAVYSVKNLEVSRKFYESVLGFVPESVWVDEETKTGMIEYGFGPDNMFTLAIGTEREGFMSGKDGGATVAIEVEDFDAAIAALKNAKTVFTLEPMESSMCHMAVIRDPDQNQLMIHKRKGK
jgi:predicted enzyme related to lactoylglutathione lyase